MQSFSSIAGLSEVGPKKKSESWSTYWERRRQMQSGMTGARFTRQDDQSEKRKKWDDFFNLLAQLSHKSSLFDFNRKSDLVENRWQRRLDNTRELATAFMVPVGLAANDAPRDAHDAPHLDVA